MHVVDEETDFSADAQRGSTLEMRAAITRANENSCRVAGDSLAGMIGQRHQMVHHGLAIRGLLLLLGADVWRSS